MRENEFNENTNSSVLLKILKHQILNIYNLPSKYGAIKTVISKCPILKARLHLLLLVDNNYQVL